MKKLLAVVVALAAGALVFAKVRLALGGRPVARGHHPLTAPTTARRAGNVLVEHGDVAQLAEHRLCKAGVRGSIPLVSTTLDQRNVPVSRVIERRVLLRAVDVR